MRRGRCGPPRSASVSGASGGRLPEVQAKLYPYQTDGVAFLAGRGRALLADDMGLGKTLQAIAAAYWLHRHDGVERVLVVCPASLKLQWARGDPAFYRCRGPHRARPGATRGVQYRKGKGFYVVNYELVMRDLGVINAESHTDLLILDEAQRIKNWRTKIAGAVEQIGSRYAFVLTGTPLENPPGEPLQSAAAGHRPKGARAVVALHGGLSHHRRARQGARLPQSIRAAAPSGAGDVAA